MKQKKRIKNGLDCKIEKYCKEWERRCYSNGIPDEAPTEIKDKVPNYKSIAMCILNNDLHLSGIGFSRPNTIYYGELKRIELESKGKIQKQYKLF